MEHAASVGIIGGADGPTVIFMASGSWLFWAVPVLILTACIGGWLFCKKYRRRNQK